MATAITEFYDALRIILGDRDAELKTYEDDALARGIRTAIKMGKLKGFKLTSDQNSIYPDIPVDGSGDPNKFALLVYHVAKMFVDPTPDRYSYRTRAMSETFGSLREFIFDLGQHIYELENGTYFSTWQSFSGWFKSLYGVEFWQLMTEVKVDAPFDTLTVNSSGTSSDSASKTDDMDTSIPFTSVGALVVGAYLLGEYKSTRKAEVTTVIVNCKPPVGTAVVLTMELNGAGVGTVTINPGESRVETLMNEEIKDGDTIRWKCTAAPAAVQDSATEVALNMTVSPRY